MVDALRHPNKEVTVALVGKYTALHDAYISVVEALKHGGIVERGSHDELLAQKGEYYQLYNGMFELA